MRFLQDFRTWDAFITRYPGMKGFEEWKTGGWEQNVYEDPDTILDFFTYDHSQYGVLVARYGKAALLYGIGTLLGIGKGKNEHVLHLGSVMLKFGGASYNMADARDRRFQGIVLDCVNEARRITKAVCQRFDQSSDALLDEVIGHHFRIDRSAPQWNTVRTNFVTLRNSLDGMLRISDNVPGATKGSAAGYVTWKNKTDYNNSILSPYKTAGANPRDKEPVYAGSIHIDYVYFKKITTGSVYKIWSNLGLAGLIVHEGSHKFCFTDDYAYVHDGEKYENLGAELRVGNADSYAYVATSIGAEKLIASSDDPLLQES